MARRKKSKNPFDYVEIPDLEISSETKKSLLVLFIMILAVLCLLGLFDLAGTFGRYLARGQTLAFGWGKWLFPLLLFWWGFLLYKRDRTYFRGAGILGIFLAFIALQAFFQIFIPLSEWNDSLKTGAGGGYVGLFLASNFIKVLGFWGGLVVLFALLVVSGLLIFNTSLLKLIGGESVFAKTAHPFRALFGRLFGGREREEEAEVKSEENLFTKKSIIEEAGDEEPEETEEPSFARATEGKPAENEQEEKEFAGGSEQPARKMTEREIWKTNKIKIDLPLELLDSNSSKPTSGDIKNNSLIIQRTLENFGIPVAMAETQVGPTVTQYAFRPAEGVKLSKITTLSNDLALALSAHPIRIEAPIPGKPLVGVEVPNKTKAIVGLKEILESGEFKARKNNLTIALGKDVAGVSWCYDITRMPHLLVAGATNSGKSVCLNSIVVSLLYQNNPEDLRFIMVDPKRVELTVYDGIPHLLTPVITNVPKTINALRWCLNEMDRRFEVLQNFKKRNIQAYNASAREKMPYIIFIVDELADLMVAAGRDIEASVIRLAQMARAVGIHLVLATQRPSVDVITGLIKANMPARIAFSVASSIDSKTILDGMGAEKLLGKGDMLFQTPEISKPKRLQGAYVSDNEIKRIVDYIKDKGGDFEYVDGVTEKQSVHGIASVGIDGQTGDEDELLAEAKELIIKSGKASASMLQRRLSVGYARAARLLDELEEAGIIGPSNGAKPREIMITQSQYEAMASQPIAGASLHDRAKTKMPENFLGEENSLGEAPAFVPLGGTTADKPDDDAVVFTGEYASAEAMADKEDEDEEAEEETEEKIETPEESAEEIGEEESAEDDESEATADQEEEIDEAETEPKFDLADEKKSDANGGREARDKNNKKNKSGKANAWEDDGMFFSR
ncbi:MAG TPA: DNA translocase FtsK 4TM domain-containing protein [Candidatus Nanoarchaeia archaeon]|nr:DNA translocase FtsK 4TM domain-containing protein [Candidatus Nanoarchaeia archaeon]